MMLIRVDRFRRMPCRRHAKIRWGQLAGVLLVFAGFAPNTAMAQTRVIKTIIKQKPSAGSAPNTATAQTASEALVPAQFNRKIQDAMGFQWDINAQGCVQSGSNCFQSAGALMVNGSSFSPTQNMMTKDGMEYVLTGSRSGIQITRRIRIDVRTGTARYVEVLHNPGSAPVTLSIQIATRIQSSVRSAITNLGRTISSSSSSEVHPLADKECGIVVTRSSTSYPAVVCYLTGARSDVKPTVQRQGSYQFVFAYSLTVPANETVSLIHGLAQRKGISSNPAPNSLAALFKPFQDRRWTQDLPADVRRSLLNADRPYYSAETVRGPILQSVMNLAAHWDVERGQTDVLVQNEETRVPGMVLGSELTVDTQFGKATVPLADVAVLVGGAGVGRPMRVLLRNGETLVGAVTADELILEADTGLELELVPKYVNTLFFHTDPTDGKPTTEAGALLKTHRGDQLIVKFTPEAKIRATTAWGPVEVALSQIDYLYPLRDPHPIHRLLMNDKTRLSAVLSGADLQWSTLQFEKLTIAPGAISRLAGLQADRSEEDDEEILKVPHCQLAGGNILVGTIDAAKLQIQTAGGVTPLDARLLRVAERVDDEIEGEAIFSFELDNGTKLEGRLRDGVLPIRALGKSWKIPEYHVLRYVWPKDTEEATAVPQPVQPATEDNSAPPTEPQDPFSPPGGSDPFGSQPTQPVPAGADPFGGGNPFGAWAVQPAGINT